MSDIGNVTQGQVLRIWIHLRKLINVAQAARTNFEWLLFSGARSVHFLDADVVYAAFRTQTATEAVAAQIDGSPITIFDLEDISGPSTVRKYLSELSDYCLPAGSIAELDHARRKYRREASARAEFISTWVNASGERKSLSEISRMASHQSLSSVFREELVGLATRADEIDLIDSLISGASNLSDLMGDTRDPEADATYDRMMRALTQERPKSVHQNMCDALNAGSVVQVFNRSTRSVAPAVLPVLISSTKHVLKNGHILSDHLSLGPSQRERHPWVVTDRRYLFIVQAISNFVGREKYRPAIDYVVRLEQDCRKLSTFCEAFLPRSGEAEPDTEAAVSMTSADLNRFAQLNLKFRRDWSQFLWPYVQARQIDRVSWINQLFSPEIERNLNSYDANSVRCAVRQLRERLRQYGGATDFWQTIESYAELKESPEINGPFQVIQVSKVPADGTPLSISSSGVSFDPYDKANLGQLEQPHDFRLLMHPPHGFGGVAFAIDTWLKHDSSEQRWVRLTWRHALDSELLWSQCMEVACMVQRGLGNDIPLKCKLFMAERIGEHATEPKPIIYWESDLESVRNRAQVLVDANYLEIQIGMVTIFADIAPLEDVELQAGLVFPATSWNAELKRGSHMSRLLSAFSQNHFSLRMWRDILNLMAPYLGSTSSSANYPKNIPNE